MAVKPPNILIYCCKNSSIFESVSRMLVANVGTSRYTLYQLDELEPWQRHCSLVVIASHPHEVSHRALSQIKQFSRDGGKILSMGGYFSSLLPLESFEVPPGPCLDHLCYSPSHLPLGQGKEKSLLMIPASSFCDKKVLSKVLLELGIVGQNHLKTELQPLHVYSRSPTILDKFFESVKSQCSINMDGELLFPMSSVQDDSNVPIIRKSCTDTEFFKDYEDIEFPEVFIHSNAVTSTQDLLWNNSILTSSSKSIAMLADVQISGKGRGKNQWISPIGSMCFSFYFTLPPNVHLTRKLPFVQYITTLATVRAVDEIYETNLSIKIKWPNDIYTSDGANKVGGVLVNCSNNGSSNQLCVGIGLNVNNSDPTLSLAKLSGTTVPVARLASRICHAFVEEIELFNEMGHAQFIERFCQKWLHQDKTVKVSVGKINCDAVIKSIDSDGYLSVLNLTTNKVVSVQPDGNSFDMMENLIAVKSN